MKTLAVLLAIASVISLFSIPKSLEDDQDLND